jgi:hypothetical protein
VLLGVATLIRVQELAMGVVVAIEVVAAAVKDRPNAIRWLAGGALALGVTVLVFAPQLLEWHLVFGKMTELPQGAKYTRLEAPMIMEVLFAPRNGWFSTTPIAYACVLGLALVPKQHRLIGAGLIAATLIQVYLNSTILDWWGGAAYGQRRMTNVTLPLVVGLAALLGRLGRLRMPVWLKHGLALAILAPLVAWNLAKVNKLRSGKPAHAELVSDGGIVATVFEFPANAIFALRHGVGLTRWDRTVGDYPLVPSLDSLLSDKLWQQRGGWGIGANGDDRYIVGGLGPVVGGAHPHRDVIDDSATILVPNLMPYGQRLVLSLGPGTGHHAKVLWNGDTVAELDLAAWQGVTFDLPDIALHTNELTIEGKGVQVGDLELTLLPPR